MCANCHGPKVTPAQAKREREAITRAGALMRARMQASEAIDVKGFVTDSSPAGDGHGG